MLVFYGDVEVFLIVSVFEIDCVIFLLEVLFYIMVGLERYNVFELLKKIGVRVIICFSFFGLGFGFVF